MNVASSWIVVSPLPVVITVCIASGLDASTTVSSTIASVGWSLVAGAHTSTPSTVDEVYVVPDASRIFWSADDAAPLSSLATITAYEGLPAPTSA